MDSIADGAEAARLAEELGYPVMVKAALGGGGKGMRLVERPEDLASAFRAARSESISSFGREEVYLEKAIVRPRHIEVQVLGDERGEMVWLGERECSIQRRHQKVIEEAPSPVVDEALRRRLGEAAVSIAREAGYTNAGTVEFLLGQDGEFYFLEMNARLQVEHPVTELLTGRDLVKEQLHVAAGEPLRFRQEDITLRGHAIEGRVYAEDPDRDFIPSPGRISLLRLPGGPGVRNEVGVYEGGEVPIHYDPLLAKLVVWGADREEAVGRMARALGEFQVLGVRTTLPFLRRVMEDDAFREGRMDTTYIDALLERDEAEAPSTGQEEAAALAAALEHGLGARGAAVPGVRRGSTWRAQGRREALRRR
jgi:acetyl-CoA carboxylase biotin carboxylase subunit